jgi:hypothetical protein
VEWDEDEDEHVDGYGNDDVYVKREKRMRKSEKEKK